ncbi:MAG: hypothetical protein C4309_04395 [Chloroflexota bacterium]
MGFVLMLHSLVRWVIVIVAVIALVRLALGWVRGNAFGRLDRGLVSGFAGLMDLQALLGLIYLFWSGLSGDGFPAYRILHAFIMIAAVAVAHLGARSSGSGDVVRYRNALLSIVAALALIVVGVAILPQGWLG